MPRQTEISETAEQKKERLLDEFVTALQADRRILPQDYLDPSWTPQEKNEFLELAVIAVGLTTEAMARHHYEPKPLRIVLDWNQIARECQ